MAVKDTSGTSVRSPLKVYASAKPAAAAALIPLADRQHPAVATRRGGRTAVAGRRAVQAGAPQRVRVVELSHAILATLAHPGSGPGWAGFPFQVEATRDGTLRRWTGLEWVTVLAGSAVLGPGDRIQWMPSERVRFPCAFVVRRLGVETGLLQPTGAPVFLVAVDEDGHLRNVFAEGDSCDRADVADALLESKEELRRLSGLLVSIQEDERRRIALDLHDSLGQSLSLIKLSIENSAHLLACGASDQAAEALRQLVPRVKEALADVRRVSSQLRPVILDDLGIVPALTWFVREFETNASGIRVESTLAVGEQDVPASLHITIFRIVQEALHNIIKHADASRVFLRVERTGRMLHLLIEDDGRGFDPSACRLSETGGLGLLSMRERACVTGGSYLLRSSRGSGTTIRASWPCDVAD